MPSSNVTLMQFSPCKFNIRQSVLLYLFCFSLSFCEIGYEKWDIKLIMEKRNNNKELLLLLRPANRDYIQI